MVVQKQTWISKIDDPKVMCMDCYMRELMQWQCDSSNAKELDDKTTEAQQRKSFAVVNSDVFNVQWCHSDTVWKRFR